MSNHFKGDFGGVGEAQVDSSTLYENRGQKKGTSDVVLSDKALHLKGIMNQKNIISMYIYI